MYKCTKVDIASLLELNTELKKKLRWKPILMSATSETHQNLSLKWIQAIYVRLLDVTTNYPHITAQHRKSCRAQTDQSQINIINGDEFSQCANFPICNGSFDPKKDDRARACTLRPVTPARFAHINNPRGKTKPERPETRDQRERETGEGLASAVNKHLASSGHSSKRSATPTDDMLISAAGEKSPDAKHKRSLLICLRV